MSDADRGAELNRRLRENYARRHRHSFVGGVAAALGRPAATVELLELDAADPLRERCTAVLEGLHRGEVRAAAHHAFETTDPRELKARVDAILREFPAVPLYLFRHDAQYFGAVITSADEILARLLDLVVLDDEDMIACDESTTCGVHVQYVSEPAAEGTTPTYIVDAWVGADLRGAGDGGGPSPSRR